MQQWEYTAVEVALGHLNVLLISRVNGVDQPGRPPLMERLVELGDAGWELSGSLSSQGGGGTLIFKRPKA